MQVALDDYARAAEVATDLVNSAPGVWSGVDKLPDTAALERFVAEHEMPGCTAPAGGAAELDAVHRLRARVRDLIDRPEREHLVAGATALAAVAGGVTLVEDGPRTRWAATLAEGGTLPDALALVCGVGVLGVVHILGVERFRPCDAATCSGAFIDTSRPGRRRYCMPEICGNRVNVANHRSRRGGR